MERRGEKRIDEDEKRLIEILFVDDESGAREQAEIFLEEESKSLSVDTFSGPEDAIKRLKKKDYDVVVSDYLMPDMDGLEFLDKVRDLDNKIPFILLTGKGTEEIAMTALNKGADRYFVKRDDPATQYRNLAQAIEEIVELRRAEKALKKSEQRYRSLFERIPIGMYRIGPEGKIQELNPRMAEILGPTDREDLRGENFLDFFAEPDDKDRWMSQIEYKGMIDGQEIKLQDKNGEEVWIENISLAVKDQEGKTLYHEGSIREISEQKKAESELREKHRELETLLSNLPGMAYRCLNNENMTMKFVSEGCKKLTGYEPEDLIDDNRLPFSELIFPEDREVIREEMQTALEKEAPFQLTYRIETAEGEKKWVREKGQGIFEDGEVKFLEGLIQDITTQKLMEQMYENMLENSLNAVITLSEDMRIERANQKFLELVGKKREDVEGEQLSSIIGEEEEDKIERFRDQKDLSGETHHESYHAVIEDEEGEEKEVMVSVFFLLYPGKTMVSFFDVTEWRSNEELISEIKSFELEGEEDLLETLSRRFSDMIQEETVRGDIKNICLQELAILVIANKGKVHGKGIIDELRESFGLSISAGTMYPILHELEEKDILEKHEGIKSKKYSLKEESEGLNMAREKIQSIFSLYLLLHQLYRNYKG
ncbi:MAG: PAS domain S-box protein [Candidatus Thermoplasmatota archaeon]